MEGSLGPSAFPRDSPEPWNSLPKHQDVPTNPRSNPGGILFPPELGNQRILRMSRGDGWDGDDPEGIPADPWNYARNLHQHTQVLVEAIHS